MPAEGEADLALRPRAKPEPRAKGEVVLSAERGAETRKAKQRPVILLVSPNPGDGGSAKLEKVGVIAGFSKLRGALEMFPDFSPGGFPRLAGVAKLRKFRETAEEPGPR